MEVFYLLRSVLGEVRAKFLSVHAYAIKGAMFLWSCAWQVPYGGGANYIASHHPKAHLIMKKPFLFFMTILLSYFL